MKNLMSERRAAQLAKGIYDKHRLGGLTDKKAAEMLDILSPYFSQTQFIRYLDWARGVKDCPNFYLKT